ncbi:MAG: hypothetical protein WC645_08740, partial [Candidatus Margulisiibacteriota bacterium]
MKLSTKMFGSFSLILGVGLILTMLSLYIMKGVSREAQVLSNQYMPQTRIANAMERYILKAIADIQGYHFSYEDSFLKDSRQQLDIVKKNLLEASELTAKYPELKTLKDNIVKASAKISEYEALINSTEKLAREIHGIRKNMDTAAQDFIKSCQEFFDEQTEDINKEAKSGATAAQMLDRISIIKSMNDVVELGYVIQLDTNKGQLVRNPKMIEDAGKKFAEMENELGAIQKKITKDTTISQLEDIRIAAANYKTNMKKLLTNFAALTDLSQKRTAAGDAVLEVAKVTATAGIDETLRSAINVDGVLRNSSRILIIGALIGALFSLIVMVLITRGITKPINAFIGRLSGAAKQVASASEQVFGASEQLASGSSQQAAALEETSSSLEEMAAMTRQNADNAHQADALMNEVNGVMGRANQSMTALTASMKEISG